MPSLRKTVRGHMKGGHQIDIVVPKYYLFGTDTLRLSSRNYTTFSCHFANCAWLPPLNSVFRPFLRHGIRGSTLRWCAAHLHNTIKLLLLTISLVKTALVLHYRHKKAFECIYAHNEYAALAGFLTGRLLGVPNVTRLYGTFLADLMDKPFVWLRYTTAWLGFKVPHNLLICANDGTRGDEVARRLGIDLERFRFWQNGVDRPDWPADATREWAQSVAPGHLRTESKWIFTALRLSYWKRIDRILRAMRHCRDAGCDAQLLVAGDGDERPALVALAKDLDLECDVVWLGAVPHEDVWRFMFLADMFVIANDVSNRCNPLYEAIRAGLPIVSIRDRSTADLLEDGVNALLADHDDEAALGQCLAHVSSDTNLATKMRAAQQSRSDTLWTWEERMRVELHEIERLLTPTHGFQKPWD